MPVEGDNSISQKIADQSPRKIARIAGFLYLMYFVTSIIGNEFGRFVGVDAPVTVNNIMAHESLFRTRFVISLFSVVFLFLVAWTFMNIKAS